MNLCIKTPIRLKFKRFNKHYAKIRYHVDNSTNSNTVKNSPEIVCGLKALNHGFLSSKLLNSIILLLRRAVGKGRVGWPRVRICFNLRVPVTRKSAGHRMGKGKGSVKYWGVPIKAGSFVFKIRKSPRKSFFFANFAWTNLYSFFEFLDTTSSVYDKNFAFRKNYNFSEFLENLKYSSILVRTKLIYMGLLRFFFSKYIAFIKTLFLKTKSSDISIVVGKKFKLLRFNFGQKKGKLFKVRNVYGKKKQKMRLYNKIILFLEQYSDFSSKPRIFKMKRQIFFFILCLYFSKRKLVRFYTKLRRDVLGKENLKFFSKCFGEKLNTIQLLKFNIDYATEFGAEGNIYDASYHENKMLAQYTQTYSETKISYLPSLYRGLVRVKHKLPFPSEIYFVDHKGIGFSYYNAITRKKRQLKHIKQR